MSENNNIKNYSAADIERYHKGQLGPEEMNAMEKAALDDPFLADAMEGYKHEAVSPGADISFLQNKLKQRIAGTKVVELKSNSILGWWKAAASIIIIIGAGILVYQFAINKGTNNVAKVQEQKQNKEVITRATADSSKTNIPTNNNDEAKTDKTKIKTNSKDVVKNDKIFKDQKTGEKDLLKSEKADATGYKSETVNSLPTALEASVSKVISKDSISTEPGRNLARSENSNVPVLVQSKKAEGEASGLFDLNKYSANASKPQILDLLSFCPSCEKISAVTGQCQVCRPGLRGQLPAGQA